MCTSEPRATNRVRFDTVQVFEYEQQRGQDRRERQEGSPRLPRRNFSRDDLSHEYEEESCSKQTSSGCCFPSEKVDLDLYEMNLSLQRISDEIFHSRSIASECSPGTSRPPRRVRKHPKLDYETILSVIEGAVKNLSSKLDTLDTNASTKATGGSRARCA